MTTFKIGDIVKIKDVKVGVYNFGDVSVPFTTTMAEKIGQSFKITILAVRPHGPAARGDFFHLDNLHYVFHSDWLELVKTPKRKYLQISLDSKGFNAKITEK